MTIAGPGVEAAAAATSARVVSMLSGIFVCREGAMTGTLERLRRCGHPLAPGLVDSPPMSTSRRIVSYQRHACADGCVEAP